jgi:hypothetical protein
MKIKFSYLLKKKSNFLSVTEDIIVLYLYGISSKKFVVFFQNEEKKLKTKIKNKSLNEVPVYKNTHLGNGNVHMHLKGLEINYCNESYH